MLMCLKCDRLFVVIYYAIIVVKVQFPVLGLVKMTHFSTYSTSSIIMIYYQQVRYVKKNELTEFGYDIISIDRIMPSQII